MIFTVAVLDPQISQSTISQRLNNQHALGSSSAYICCRRETRPEIPASTKKIFAAGRDASETQQKSKYFRSNRNFCPILPSLKVRRSKPNCPRSRMMVELWETIVQSKFSLKDIGIIGNSPPIKALARQIETTARCDLTVLITGESGTGKELVARAIHQQSERAELPFISINCGALSEGLLESELFGYERGAFTGANQKQKGLFQASHTGTIFLDEIGEVSPACQVKLLRVLQEGAVRPVGGHTEIAVDVRVITATNRNLHKEISTGKFREDLFYRIAVMTIDAPPLRKRASDIPLLVEHFLRQAEQKMRCPYRRKIEQEGLATLSAYTWPGNVRQLRNVIERLVAITFESELITTEAILRALPASLLSEMATQLPVVFRENDSLDDFLDRMLLRAYEQLRKQTGSHSKAARLLRTDRVSLYQRIARARERINGDVASGEAR